MGSKLMTAEQSTFMIDLHQVGMMLRHATSRSLCLLDEFGKGTLNEGLHCALLAGLPKEVIDRAASILGSPGNNQTIDRVHNERIFAQDQQYKNALEKMLAFDTIHGDLRSFFEEILLS
ncbi:hypothetical protein CRG98_005435 [Punica granatum]|uniref:DNA mismatch repair proteins mutS family domain-containing protein n=1 Tax=Punica granatum TaxID=22663 RepID=A0A2I0L0F0_PUNGR|nr:hypothetical protein CRG98_005435 [Punica granatum]